MTTAELIAYYKAQAETTPGLTLANINEFMAANPWPIERTAALATLKAEVQAVLDEQALAAWLTTNAIPEAMWGDYSYSGGVLSYQGAVVNG